MSTSPTTVAAVPRSILEDLLYKSEEEPWGQLSRWMKDNGELDSELFPTGNPDAISPFVLAAYRGKYDTVCRLLEDATDEHSAINSTSRIIARIRGSDRLECLTSVTALLASSISGQADVAKHLLERGADVDAEDCCGWTALCRAAARGDIAITSLLLDCSSDVNHITPNGFTSAHLAAINCDINTLQLLGKHGAVLSHDGINDVPCPLYVAAACGHRDVVEKLTSDPTCPVICKINAELLLGAAMYLQGSSLVPHSSNSGCRTLARWRDALSLLDYHRLALNVAPPSPYYGAEITDVQEFDDAYRHGWFPQVLHQSLMIRERCLGPDYTVMPEMLDWLLSFAKQTSNLPLRKNETVSPWEMIAPAIIHIMDIHIQLCQKYFERAHYCQLLECMDTATSYILFPVFNSGYHDMQLWIACVEYAISLLQLCFLMATGEGYPCGNPPKLVPIIIDFLIHVALMDDIATNDVSEQNASENPTIECSLELVNACWHFVQTCAPHPEQAGEVLNATISQSARENSEECGVILQLLLYWFVHCGMPGAINTLDHNGERPLCLAAKLHYATLPNACRMLLNYGAHPDVTNAEGKTAADFLSPFEAQKLGFDQVPQLKCLASRKILAAKLPYDMLDLQLVEFIRMHSTPDVEKAPCIPVL